MTTEFSGKLVMLGSRTGVPRASITTAAGSGAETDGHSLALSGVCLPKGS